MAPGTEVLIGREAELALLGAALQDVRAGRPRVVVVQGPAGIGKTALVRTALAAEQGVRVLWASGDEVEIALSYGVTDQLARQANPRLPAQPLTAAATPLPGPIAVGADLVEALGTLQEAGPVAVVVDDAHWCDLSSLQALTFALRRLLVDQVVAVFVLREEGVARLPEGLTRLVAAERGLQLRLGGLDAPAIQCLATALGCGPLSRRGALHLQSHTGGNPLHVTALLQELPPELLAASPGPLPAPRSYAQAVLTRLASCPPPSQHLLRAASVLGIRFPLHDAGRLGAIDDPLGALEPAAASGLVLPPTFTEARVSFAHPLVQAAVYHDLGPAQRSALHARAAAMAPDEAASLRHRIAAAQAPDPTLCATVTAYARREAARGALSSAASHLLAASRLNPDPEAGELLLLDALEFMLLGSDVEVAVGLAGRVASFCDVVRRDYGLGLIRRTTGPLAEADILLSAALDACDPLEEAEIGSRLAQQLAIVRLMQGRGLEAADLARCVLSSPVRSIVPLVAARTALIFGYAIAGQPTTGLGLIAASEWNDFPAFDDEFLQGRGHMRLWTDDLEGAQADLSSLANRWRQLPLNYGVFSLAVLADAEYRLGAWDESVVHGHVAGEAMDDTGQVWLQSEVHAMAMYAPAARGDWDAAHAHVDAARVGAREFGGAASLAYSCSAQACLAHARGDWTTVVESVEPLLHLEYRDGTYEPGVVPWRETYLDALVSLGRLEEADCGLIPFEEIAADRGRRSAMGNAARVRGRLEAAQGCADRAEEAFQAALAHGAAVPIPFDLAQTELAYGAFLRRQGQRAQAVAHLKAAHERLAALRARPYLERCDRELAACGLTPAKRRAAPVPGRLIPQELSVARLVTSGLTNRQVASELVVSTRTVEYHLANLYTKLGITSRTQLAVHLAKAQ